MSTKIHFRPHINNQTVLFPQRIDKDIAQDDPVRLVNSVVESLDLAYLKKLYRERDRRRFRHFSKDKVTMDFAFFAIAFNIKKWAAKTAKSTKNTKNGGNTPHFRIFRLTVQNLLPENRIFWRKTEKQAA